MFGISPMQLLIILVIVVLLFGTKKLRTLGSDLGSAVKGFKKSVSEKDADFDENESKQVEDKTAQTSQAADPSVDSKTKSEQKPE